MKRKLTVAFLAMIMALSLAFGIISASAEGTSAWTAEGNTVTVTNQADKYFTNAPAALYLEEAAVYGDYTVSTEIQGSKSISETTSDRYDVGLIAYYLDANNWISVSLSWWANWSTDKVIDVLTVKCVDGVCAYEDHYYNDPEFAGDGYNFTTTDKIAISVKKVYDEAKGVDVYTVTVGGDEVYSTEWAVSATNKEANARVGYCCNAADATFTFSKAVVTPIVPEGSEEGGEVVEPVNAWAKEGETITVANQAGLYYANAPEAFFMEDFAVSGDYTVSTTIKGSKTIEGADARYDVGLVAYYLDQNNWISASISWWPGWVTTKVIDILTVKCTNGALAYEDHFYDNAMWNFHTAYNKDANEEILISATKAYDAVNVCDVYTFSFDGVELYSTTWGVSSLNRSVPAKVGYCANAKDATFTFTEATIAYPGIDGTPVSYNEIEGVAGSKAVGEWTYADGKYTVNSTGTIAANHAIIPNAYAAENYNFNAKVTATNVTDSSKILLSGWYFSATEQVMVYLTKTASGLVATIEGSVGGQAIEVKTANVSEEAGVVDITINKTGNRIKVLQGEAVLFELSNDKFADGTAVVIGAENVNAVFEVAITDAPYNAYDFYRESVNGKTYRISAKDAESVVITASEITVAAEAEKETRVLWSENTSGTVALTAAFAGEAAVGFYAYYMNEENNVAFIVDGLTVKMRSIINGVVAEKEATLESAITSITVKMEGNNFTAVSGDVAIFNETVEGVNIVNEFEIGIIVEGGEATVSEIAIEKFVPFANKVVGDYIFCGDSYATWQLVGDTVIGNVDNGTTWAATRAFHALEKKAADGYNVGAAIKVTEKVATEWKAGILPWFIDGGNFMYVWISERANEGVTITMTCWINGAVCAPEWRETPVTCNIEDLNYLEIGIKGDEVSVYLNKGFAPAYRVNFEGLGAVEATAPFLAFNIFNVSAEFSELTITDGERIFKNEIAPSISMIGDKVTTATVGKKVSIPVVVASSAIETGSAQATIKVTLNGEEITLEKNSFVPQTAGEYVVTITATDDWSLTTTEVYTITVTEAQGGDSNADVGKIGCKSAMGASSALMLAVFGIAAVALKKRR